MFSKLLAVFDRPPADPVAKNFPLLGSPWPVTLLILGYLLFVLNYGKKFMQHRQPYDIKKIIILYNLFQVIYNAIMFGFMFYYFFIDPAYPLDCLHTFPLDDPKKNIERVISYTYFVNKIIDLLDTIFFVLRKSYKQITFLHVYHHALMVSAMYWVFRIYGFGGQFFTMALANTFVHSVMYFYYMISAIYTGLKGSIWWKKYITKLQIFQFVSVMLHSVYILVFNPKCECPLIVHLMIFVLGVIFISLFTNFYIKAYVKPRNKKQQ
ncbi:elongation of very long chain fatty acids protein F-like isoform X3 [Drosophila innubila]|uniref:elongation of very long chain fatty acids protein F-like isoform X3 n=1 Tax=Drosophila innubila TaxID=198719 RepID=UPI00148C7CCC|nr:elongation of very long chain fatty acids protein F-like isoform X3 [Drosophila innubila]